MPEGREVRDIVQSASPAGAANQPARQLGLVGVQAPRGGSIGHVGNAEKVLAEAVKLGGSQLQGWLEKRDAKQELELEVMFQQGVTEQEAVDRGYKSNLTKGVYQALNLKTGYTDWLTGASADATTKYADLDPTEYREQVLNPEFSQVVDMIPADDPDALALYTTIGRQGIAALVQQHGAAHAQHVQRQTEDSLYDMLVSTSSSPDTEDLQDTVASVPEWADELGQESSNAVVKSAVIDTLNSQNVQLFDAMGGEAGLKDMGLNPADIKSVHTALDTYLRSNRTTTMTARLQDEVSIMNGLKGGTIAPEDAVQRAIDIKDKYRLDKGYVEQFVSSARTIIIDTAQNEDEMEDRLNAPFRMEVGQLVSQVGWEGLTDDSLPKLEALGKKYDIAPDVMQEFATELSGAQESYEDTRDKELKDAGAKVVKQRQTVARAEQLSQIPPAQWSKDPADKAAAQMAFRVVEQQASVAAVAEYSELVQADPDFEDNVDRDGFIRNSMTKAFSDTLRKTTVIDNDLKNRFAIAGSLTNPIDEDGQVAEEVQIAAVYYDSMREAGITTSKLRTYAGDLLPTLELISYGGGVSNGEVSKGVVQAAYDSTAGTGPEQLNTPANLVKAWVSGGRDKFTTDIEPGMLEMWGGSNASSEYRDVYTPDVERAFADPSVDKYYAERVLAHGKLNPQASDAQVHQLAKTDMRDLRYVAGTLIPPVGGETVLDMMGIPTIQGDLVENKAFWVHMTGKVIPQMEEAGLLPEFAPDQTFLGKVGKRVREGFASNITFGRRPFSETWQMLETGNQFVNLHPRDNGVVEVYFFEDENREFLRGSTLIKWKDVGNTMKDHLGIAREQERTGEVLTGEAADTELGGQAGDDVLPGRKPDVVLHGSDSIAKARELVQDSHGRDLTPFEEEIARVEGYSRVPYKDTGNKKELTTGFGFTGENIGKDLPTVVAKYVNRTRSRVGSQFDRMPEDIQLKLLSLTYRGDMRTKVAKAIRAKQYGTAADMILASSNYKDAKRVGSGIAVRLEENAAAVRAMAQVAPVPTKKPTR